jgi:serine/threonine-protein kinase
VDERVIARRYRIVRQIGAGGMGSVHEAVDQTTEQRVALKLIEAEISKDPTMMRRFEREARAAGTLDTPHIVKLLDAGVDQDGGVPFLVMEFLQGEDVHALVSRLGPLPPELALRIAAQGCLGLSKAHEARIVHRDIKPANFFLAHVSPRAPQSSAGPGDERILKLLDFGIAKITRDPNESHAETAGLTRTGSLLGSPLYMSPEQARGSKEVDQRADVWSMGVVLYQMLTGHTPHEDTTALGELIISICTEEPPPVQQLSPWVPPDIAAIAHHAMRFDPNARYQSGAEMLEAIRAHLPNGFAIVEGALRGLAEGDRGRVQPRLVTAPDTPMRRSGAVTARTGPDADEKTSGTSLEGLGGTLGDASSPAPRTSPARTWGVPIAVGVAVAVALVGGAALRFGRGSADAKPATPSDSASALPQPVVTPAEPKARTVKLVVLPSEATVEVDGTPATVIDGAVEVVGALGSVHKVRVKSGAAEVLREVAISEQGALPPKIEAAAAPTAEPPKPPVPTTAPKPLGKAGPTPPPLRTDR